MAETPWYVSLFGEEYLRAYGPMLSPERTAQEVDGIVKLLGLPPGAAILDLACGHGRHAIPLAERGYQVTGQDLSEVFLERARGDAQVQGVDVRWVQGDMRDVAFENEFDAVLSIFTAFGYFENEAENELVLREIHKALRSGGRFLIDTMHRDSIARGFQPTSVTRHDDGTIVIEERRFDQLRGRVPTEITLIYPDGRRAEIRHDTRVYTLTELAGMMARASLELEAYFGGLNGDPLTRESQRLVVMARKPKSM